MVPSKLTWSLAQRKAKDLVRRLAEERKEREQRKAEQRKLHAEKILSPSEEQQDRTSLLLERNRKEREERVLRLKVRLQENKINARAVNHTQNR